MIKAPNTAEISMSSLQANHEPHGKSICYANYFHMETEPK